MRRSINRKISVLFIIAIGTAMVSVALFGCYSEAIHYLEARRDALLGTADAFAAASANAVATRDPRAASLAIRGIASVPAIDFAALRDADNRLFASVGSGVRLASDLDLTEANAQGSTLALLTTRTVSVTVPVRSGGRTIGHLTLIGDLDLRSQIASVVLRTAAEALIALIIGLACSFRLQRSITAPLVKLANAMTSIRLGHDYETKVAIDSDDEVGLLATSFNDMIGEIHARDTQLVAHRDRLEQDVADRTQDLRLAKEEAESANASKSTFLATMSHEIRTPMTGLLVMAELLAAEDLPAKSRRYADVICKSGSALLAIINDILDLSKIEAEKLEIEQVPMNVREIVGTVLNLFFSRAMEKDLDLAACFAADVPVEVTGDPVRMQQIVSNLVNNALKFTTSGHVLVDVRWDDGSLVVDVVDTGEGIAEDKLGRIFEAFSQADGSTTRKFGGTGLGLTISTRLAEAMGGRISVASQLGAGSTFTCRIPAAPTATATEAVRDASGLDCRTAAIAIDRDATRRAVGSALANAGLSIVGGVPGEGSGADLLVLDRAAYERLGPALASFARVILVERPGDEGVVALSPSHAAVSLPILEDDLLQAVRGGPGRARDPVRSRPTTVAPRFAGARVLVADDTAVNREVMTAALGRFGIKPDLVEDGLEALQSATSRRYDLVFMDGSMPHLDGFEACRRLRAAEPDGRRTIVLALTAHVVGTAADAWREAGMDGVLHKPFAMRELEQVLVTFLAAHEGAAVYEGMPMVDPQPGPAADEPILDESVLADIGAMSQGESRGFAERVFGLFVEHAPRSWTTLTEAVAAQDDLAVASAAHAIKSMSLNIGAKRVGSAAAQVERSARAGAPEAAALAALDDALSLTLAELTRRTQGRDGVLAA